MENPLNVFPSILTAKATEQLTERSKILRIPGLKLIEQIGRGGMSSVWKAWDIPAQRLVAVKILDDELAKNGEEVRAFREEERFMEEVKHPGFVEAYGFDCGNGHWYLKMEYVDGYSFSSLLKRKGRISEQDCLLICESVATALDFLWNNHGIVHCDIKPENIMINSEGIVKLTDLGISHRYQFFAPDTHPASENVAGTPAYISPEQIYGDVELDCRADIYSLGATLYHLATGRILFPMVDNDTAMRSHCNEDICAPDPRQLNPKLSRGFAQLIEAMLVKNRDARIQPWSSVYDMAREVERGSIFSPRDTSEKSSVALDDY